MQIAIVQFPGSNCERETILAVERAGMQAREFLWNEPKEKLMDFAGFIIVGGFSYEDRSRAGIIAALDPVMQAIKQQSQLGKPVLGICNGAQILVEAGLVPGLEREQLGMALTDNKRMQQTKVLGTGYYNAWVSMRLSDGYQLNAFTRYLTPKNILQVPVAHAEGRFVIPPVLLAELKRNGLCVFQYCDTKGDIIDSFPVNPNGSVHNIAAITNKAGNVMAMMPHPERTLQGDAIFKSMCEYIKEGTAVQSLAVLDYQPRSPVISKYEAPAGAYELVIDLMITDNQAVSVQNALQHNGLPVKIKRTVHWEISCDGLSVLEKIKSTGVLFNDRKEKQLTERPSKNSHGAVFLVRAKEDMQGQQALQLLKNHFDIKGVHRISRSVLWQVEALQSDAMEQIIHSHILWNPYAHECYYY